MRRTLAWAILALSLAPAMAPLLAAAPAGERQPTALQDTVFRRSYSGAVDGDAEPKVEKASIERSDLQYSLDSFSQAPPAESYEGKVTLTLSAATTVEPTFAMAVAMDEPSPVVMLDTEQDASIAHMGLRLHGLAATDSASYLGEPTVEEENGDAIAVLMAASQQFLGALALSPYTNAHGPSLADLRVPLDSGEARASTLLADIPSMPGWLRQATWTLTLMALGGLAAWALASVPSGLFTRLDPDGALRHARRALLHELIRAEPGLSLAEIRRRTGLAHGPAQHHLRMLEKQSLVRSHKVGRRRCYFPAGPRVAPHALLPEAPRRLLGVLVSEPSLTTVEVARRAGRTVQTVWPQLQLLEGQGFVAARRQGRAMSWFAV